ncbi:MAG: hypothetical protein JO307_11145 [Bryobacterales bacterium]|nr:hypothetical protein [Bryobacterales bacterium]MBV9397645.1 hypothetical protein [Bryobacterales bacterium]
MPRFGLTTAEEMVADAGTPAALIVTTTGPTYPVKALTVKLPDVKPAASVRAAAGTDSKVLLLDTFNVSPPAGAGATRVKVQVLVCPAVNLAGVQVTDLGGTKPIVKLPD